ncbi:MAG: hypothetical protein ABII00_15930, partial [Elusimicrobiota bacterium]
ANEGVGHIFPAGPEADLIEAWLHVTAKDGRGKKLFEYGVLDAKGHLDDKKTYVYRVYPFDRHGEPLELDRHRSWLFAKDGLHVIRAKHYDDVPFRISIPANADFKRIRIEARLRYRRPNQSFVDWLVGEGKVTAPIVDMAESEIEVGLSRDRGVVKKASKKWQAELEKGMEGFEKKPRFDDPLLEKYHFESRAIIILAQQAFRKGDYAEALRLLDSLDFQSRDIVGLRAAIVGAMRENRPADGY